MRFTNPPECDEHAKCRIMNYGVSSTNSQVWGHVFDRAGNSVPPPPAEMIVFWACVTCAKCWTETKDAS